MNYKQAVKEKFPDAICVGVSLAKTDTKPTFHMVIGCGLGENYNLSRSLAWKNAYEKAVLKTA